MTHTYTHTHTHKEKLEKGKKLKHFMRERGAELNNFKI